MEDNNFEKRLKVVEAEISLLRVLKSIELFKFYNGENIDLHINQYSKNYEQIILFFKYLKIDFKSFLPFQSSLPFPDDSDDEEKDPFSKTNVKKNAPKKFSLTFDLNTNFQNLYIIIEILNNFGLEKVFYSNETGNSVTIGSYSEHYDIPLSKPFEIKTILDMPFYYSTINVLCQYYKVTEFYILSKLDRNLLEEFHNDNFGKRDDDDEERDTFNALTDGQYGDFEDWKNNNGDYDNLRDDLGY